MIDIYPFASRILCPGPTWVGTTELYFYFKVALYRQPSGMIQKVPTSNIITSKGNSNLISHVYFHITDTS